MLRAFTLAALAVFSALLGAAALVLLPSAPARAAADRPKAHRNLVLITLDTTRADHLGAWGWRFARTPNLDALARRGTRFAACDTAAPITLPSHASLLTGLYPPRHGVRDNGTFALAPRVETLAERLAAAGYDTAAVVSAVVLARRHGLDQGFRVYDDDLGSGYAAGTTVAERTAEHTNAAAAAALAGLRAPFFLWVHYYDPHEEYRPPTRFTDLPGPHRLYDGEIAFMDEQVGELLKRLPADTDVVAVGDHGEMLGEHGEASHGLLLFRGARRVPLIVAGPGVPAGVVHEGLVRTVDVAPTLLRLAGLPAPSGAAALDGKSLLPLPPAGDGHESYSESFLPFFAYRWYPLRALANDRFLYLKAPRDGLFDLRAGAGEERDLAASQPAAVRKWRERLASFLQARGESLAVAVRTENILSDEQRKQLASLGYAGSGTGGRVSGELPDPRRMTDVALDLHRAAQQVQEKRCAEALPRLQGIVKRDPNNFPALSLAGYCVREAGRVEDALALYRRAAAANDLSAVPIADAAGCLMTLGRKSEAEREYRRALALDPTLAVAATNLGKMLREKGAASEALAELDRALQAGAHEPEVYMERGLTRAAAGNLKGALADFREASHRDPANPVPLENAAKAAYETGAQREAAGYYEALLRLSPGRRDLWKTLGALYLYELDDPEQALPAFRHALTLETDPDERAKLEALVRELGG
jgi:arylsulfatase A-like enzyme/Tfp pilus assembly protein PilF